jgi:uncharacterized membrane protein YtjA (UPF0391 family)
LAPQLQLLKTSLLKTEEVQMLRAALLFFILALVAIIFGATGFAGVSMDIGRTLLVVFLVLAVISFLTSLVTGRGTKMLP